MNIFEATRSAILGKQKMIRVSKNGERFLIDPANDMDQCRIEVENEQRAVEKNWVPSQEELLAQDWTVTAVLPKESLSESLWWMTEAFEEHYSQKFPEFVGIVRKMTEKDGLASPSFSYSPIFLSFCLLLLDIVPCPLFP